jgi:hypothetical protein
MEMPNLPSMPADKLGHFFYGALMTTGSMCLWHTPMVSLGIVCAVAALKEFTDWLSNYNAVKQGLSPHHGVEFLDWVATVGGGVAVILPWLLK